jgi:hypothetical protein
LRAIDQGAGGSMRHVLAIAFMAATLSAPTAAAAAERVFDGALGAASGALVGGPIGLVAGGVVGFVAGPNISHGLGFHRHYRHGYYGHHAAAQRAQRQARSENR